MHVYFNVCLVCAGIISTVDVSLNMLCQLSTELDTIVFNKIIYLEAQAPSKMCLFSMLIEFLHFFFSCSRPHLCQVASPLSIPFVCLCGPSRVIAKRSFPFIIFNFFFLLE